MSGAERYRYSSRREAHASSSGRRETINRSRDTNRGRSEYRQRDQETRLPVTQRAAERYRPRRFSDALDRGRDNQRVFDHGHITKEKEETRVKRTGLSAGQDLRRKIERGRSKDGVQDDAWKKSPTRDHRDNRAFVNVGGRQSREKPFDSSASSFSVLSDNDEDVKRYRRLETDYLKYFYKRDDLEKVLAKDSVHYKADKEEIGRLSRLLGNILGELEELAQIIKRKLESKELNEDSHSGLRDTEKSIGLQRETKELGSPEPKEKIMPLVPSQISPWSSSLPQNDSEEIEPGTERNLTTKEANTGVEVLESNDAGDKAEFKDLQGSHPFLEREDLSENGQDLREKLRKGRLVRKFQEELESLDPDLREEVISAVTGSKPRGKSFESSEGSEKLVITVSQVSSEGDHKEHNEDDVRADTPDLPLAIDAAAAKKDLGTCSGDALDSLDVLHVEEIKSRKDLDMNNERWNRSVLQCDTLTSKSYLESDRINKGGILERSELSNERNYGKQSIIRETRSWIERREEKVMSLRGLGRRESRKRPYSETSNYRVSGKTQSEISRSMQGKSRTKSEREHAERKAESARNWREKEMRSSKTLVKTGSKSRGHFGGSKSRTGEGKQGPHDFASQDSDLYFKKFLSLVGDHAGLAAFSKPSSVSSHIVAPTSNYVTSAATLGTPQQIVNQGVHSSTGNAHVLTHQVFSTQLATARPPPLITSSTQVFPRQAFPPQLAMARPTPPSTGISQVFTGQTFPLQLVTPMPNPQITSSTQVFSHQAFPPQIARPLQTPPAGQVAPVPLLTQPIQQLPRPLFPSNTIRPALPMPPPSVRMPHEMMQHLSGQGMPSNSTYPPGAFFPTPTVPPPALATARPHLVRPGQTIPVLSGALSRRNTEGGKEKRVTPEKSEQGVVHANLAQVQTKNIALISAKEDKMEEIHATRGHSVNSDVLAAKLKSYLGASPLGEPGNPLSVLARDAFVDTAGKDAAKDMRAVKKSILKQPTKQFKERPDELMFSVDQNLLSSSQKRDEFLNLSSTVITSAGNAEHNLRQRENKIFKGLFNTDVSVPDKNIEALKRTSDVSYSMIRASDRQEYPDGDTVCPQDPDHSMGGERNLGNSFDPLVLRTERTGVKEYDAPKGRRNESTVSTNNLSAAFTEHPSAQDSELLWERKPKAPYQDILRPNSSIATEIGVKSEPRAATLIDNPRNIESAVRAAMPLSYASELLDYNDTQQAKESATSVRISQGATFGEEGPSPSGIYRPELKRRNLLPSAAITSRDIAAPDYPNMEDDVYAPGIKHERFDPFDDEMEAQEAPSRRSEDYFRKWESRSYSTSFNDISERSRGLVALKSGEEEVARVDDDNCPRYCNLCDVGFSTSFSAKFHLSTEKHALAVRRQRINMQTRTNRMDDGDVLDPVISAPYSRIKDSQGDQRSTPYIGKTNKKDEEDVYALHRNYARGTGQGPSDVMHYASAASISAKEASYEKGQLDHGMDLPVYMVDKGASGSSLRPGGDAPYSTQQPLSTFDYERTTKDYRTSNRW